MMWFLRFRSLLLASYAESIGLDSCCHSFVRLAELFGGLLGVNCMWTLPAFHYLGLYLYHIWSRCCYPWILHHALVLMGTYFETLVWADVAGVSMKVSLAEEFLISYGRATWLIVPGSGLSRTSITCQIVSRFTPLNIFLRCLVAWITILAIHQIVLAAQHPRATSSSFHFRLSHLLKIWIVTKLHRSCRLRWIKLYFFRVLIDLLLHKPLLLSHYLSLVTQLVAPNNCRSIFIICKFRNIIKEHGLI